MIAWLLPLLLSASNAPELWLNTNAGVTLHKHPQPRALAGLAWYPFPVSSWAGLGQVGGRAELFATPTHRGNAGCVLGVAYGRPSDTLWLSFGAGAAVFMAWGDNDHDPTWVASPEVSFRIGYRRIALRIMGFITPRGAPLAGDFYAATLEGFWLL